MLFLFAQEPFSHSATSFPDSESNWQDCLEHSEDGGLRFGRSLTPRGGSAHPLPLLQLFFLISQDGLPPDTSMVPPFLILFLEEVGDLVPGLLPTELLALEQVPQDCITASIPAFTTHMYHHFTVTPGPGFYHLHLPSFGSQLLIPLKVC